MPFDPTDPNARRIYVFFDGEKDVRVDPDVLQRRLMRELPFERMKDLYARAFGIPQSGEEEADGETPAPAPVDPLSQSEAQKELVDAIRAAFGIKPFEDGGLLERETLAAWGDFNTWQQSVKKNTGDGPSESPAPDGPPTSS